MQIMGRNMNKAISGILLILVMGPQSAHAKDYRCDANIDGAASIPLADTVKLQRNGCKIQLSHGLPVPDPACTPGAINPNVTVAVLKSKGFNTHCDRNQATTAAQKSRTYIYYGIHQPVNNIGKTQICELDHLVSLELGGADTLDNIWPQCGPDSVALRQRYFRMKDKVENYLARQVKKGRMSLEEAQRGIAADWTQYIDAANNRSRRAD
jgi:hypothetical protein